MGKNFYKFHYFVSYGMVDSGGRKIRSVRGLVQSHRHGAVVTGYVKTTRHNLVRLMGTAKVRVMEDMARGAGYGRQSNIG